MSLLQQQSPEGSRRCSPGESFTKGTSHVVVATDRRHRAGFDRHCDLRDCRREAACRHGRNSRGVGASHAHGNIGMRCQRRCMPKESFDQVLVFTDVRLHNQSKQTDLPASDCGQHQSSTMDLTPATLRLPSDYDRIFKAYPDLAQWRTSPLSTGSDYRAGRDKGRNVCCIFPHDQGRMGRAQEPGLSPSVSTISPA